MCVDFNVFIGVLIQNRDDTTIVYEMGYPTQTSTSGVIVLSLSDVSFSFRR